MSRGLYDHVTHCAFSLPVNIIKSVQRRQRQTMRRCDLERASGGVWKKYISEWCNPVLRFSLLYTPRIPYYWRSISRHSFMNTLYKRREKKTLAGQIGRVENPLPAAADGVRYVWQRDTETFNHLKPTGHVMHQQFNIQQLYALPTLYLCVLYLSENKQRLVPLTA